MKPHGRLAITMLMLLALLATFVFSPSASAKYKRAGHRVKLNKISGEIQKVLDDISQGLSAAATDIAKTGLVGPEAEERLSELCRKQNYFKSCATIDADGVLASVQPKAYKKYEGKDISKQIHIKQLMSEHKPSMSSTFKAVEGFYAVEFGWPVFDKNGNFIGAVSTLVKPGDFLGGIITPMLSWDALGIWVIQKDSVALFTKDKSLIGENLNTVVDQRKAYNYKPVLKRITSERSGSMKYMRRSSGRASPEARQCFWESVEFKDGHWRVVLVGPLE